MSVFDDIERVSSTKTLRGPVATLDFRRVLALPRHAWAAAEDLGELVDVLTSVLKTSTGTWKLQPTQAAALRALFDARGLFGPIAVGGGKTLITLLAPVVMAVERPLLLVPAAVRDQTLRKVLPKMQRHWRLHPNLKILGYSELSLAKNADLLETLQPDMIIADECHHLKNLKSGRTRRVGRYMNANPHTTFVALSGTVASYSILDYWHLIQWALKPDNTPLPKSWYEAKDWGCSLDERVRDEDRLGPGVLSAFCEPGESVRQGYRRRLTETPGVVATQADELGVSLQLTGLKPKVPQAVTTLLDQVETNWETPGGDVIMESVAMWSIRRQILSGFYYRWKVPPPPAWLDARKAWGQYVRHTLQYNRHKLDTPLQVWNAVAHADKSPIWRQWRDIKDVYTPSTEAMWVDQYLVKLAAQWLQEDGICWVEHRTMGEAVARLSGRPYYGAGDSRILDATGPIIASIAAHGTGKNLQQWDRNLVLCPPTAGGAWEQLLGRTHRQGQRQDTVTCDVVVHHPAFEQAMFQAFADARFLQDSLGNRQRLLYCDTDLQREETS